MMKEDIGLIDQDKDYGQAPTDDSEQKIDLSNIKKKS